TADAEDAAVIAFDARGRSLVVVNNVVVVVVVVASSGEPFIVMASLSYQQYGSHAYICRCNGPVCSVAAVCTTFAFTGRPGRSWLPNQWRISTGASNGDDGRG